MLQTNLFLLLRVKKHVDVVSKPTVRLRKSADVYYKAGRCWVMNVRGVSVTLFHLFVHPRQVEKQTQKRFSFSLNLDAIFNAVSGVCSMQKYLHHRERLGWTGKLGSSQCWSCSTNSRPSPRNSFSLWPCTCSPFNKSISSSKPLRDMCSHWLRSFRLIPYLQNLSLPVSLNRQVQIQPKGKF